MQYFRTAQVYFSDLIVSLTFLQFQSIVFLQSSLKYSRPALIIPTIALQSVLKIICLSYQASLRMVELHCFGKSALMIWLNLYKILIQITSLEFVVILKKRVLFLSSVYICPLRAIVSRNLMNTLTISGHYMIHYPLNAL